jgi:hypothetical protein
VTDGRLPSRPRWQLNVSDRVEGFVMNLVNRGILMLAALLIAAAGTIGGVVATGTIIWYSHSSVVNPPPAKPPNAPPLDPCDGIPGCQW